MYACGTKADLLAWFCRTLNRTPQNREKSPLFVRDQLGAQRDRGFFGHIVSQLHAMWSYERNIRSILSGGKILPTTKQESDDDATVKRRRTRSSRSSDTRTASSKLVNVESEGLERETELESEQIVDQSEENEEETNTMKQYYLTEETSRRLKVLARRCNKVNEAFYKLKLIVVVGLILVNTVTLLYVLYVYFTSPSLISSDKLWKTAGMITLLNTLPPALALGLCGIPPSER